jgi:hypothetical protein
MASKKILVYQMGKVGSSSLRKSFENNGFINPVFLDLENGRDNLCKKVAKKIILYFVPQKLLISTKFVRLEDFFQRNQNYAVHTHNKFFAREVFKNYISHNYSCSLYVVCGIRDLLKRNISAFFQNIDNVKNKWYYGSRKEILNAKIESLVSHFNSKNSAHMNTEIAPWFKTFLSSFGINNKTISPSLFKNGFYTFNHRGVKFIFYRLEDLSKSSNLIFEEVGLNGIELINENVGSSKWYSSVYREFISKYVPDEETIKLMYDSDIAKSFYTPDELEKQKSQWFS